MVDNFTHDMQLEKEEFLNSEDEENLDHLDSDDDDDDY